LVIDFSKFAKLDQSTAVPSLSRDKYNEVQIAIPPLAEQQRIVARINELFTEWWTVKQHYRVPVMTSNLGVAPY